MGQFPASGPFTQNLGHAPPDDVLPTVALIHIKQKASGQKWIGGHIWGGLSGTVGLLIDAGTCSFTNFEAERPVHINQGGFRWVGGQVYRINDASSEVGAAFVFATSLAGCTVVSRVNHFRYVLKIIGAAGAGNEFNLTHYSQNASPAMLDAAGVTLSSSNNWFYRVTGNGSSEFAIPELQATRFRRRRKSIGYAASITPDHASGDYIEVGQLTGNILINNPTNAAEGDEIQFMFQQDATGSRTLTWGSAFSGGPTAGGAAFTRRAIRFVNDGVKWILSGDSATWVA